MRIVFEPKSLHQSKRGAVTGVAYFDFGAEQFPIKGWSDFVVVIAGWWLTALDEFTRTNAQAVLRFMDGPYRITAIPQSGSSVLLRCTEDRRGAGVVQEIVVGQAELERALLDFAQAVSNACATATIESTDVDQLRRLLAN